MQFTLYGVYTVVTYGQTDNAKHRKALSFFDLQANYCTGHILGIEQLNNPACIRTGRHWWKWRQGGGGWRLGPQLPTSKTDAGSSNRQAIGYICCCYHVLRCLTSPPHHRAPPLQRPSSSDEQCTYIHPSIHASASMFYSAPSTAYVHILHLHSVPGQAENCQATNISNPQSSTEH